MLLSILQLTAFILNNLQAIFKKMPLWMSTAASLYVAAKRIESSLSKRFADSLAFFACYKNIFFHFSKTLYNQF